ncbi:MAG TPA: GYD domain-containing protein [Usitatibacter sp.]|nr:GYD domain-containing protein [Usitatibacter sp.]
MATYIVLSTFTDQGIRTVRDTTKRADGVRDAAKKLGITTKDIYWTLGSYDVVAIFEADDEASVTAMALTLGSGGNVRTQVMRAFTKDEMNGVLKKMGKG